MLKGGESGPAVLPGEPNKSLLIQAVEHADESLEMPPGKLLPKGVRDDLAAWVAAGAKWPKSASAGRTIEGRKHWAFEPLDHVSPPDDPTGWATGPIDRFIAAGQRRHGLQPAPPADKMTLIRRATFDLIGLPPTPERIEAFVADQRPDAYERLVDELLASPHYGERWGRYWLDLARYADTAGDNSDYPIPQAYLYRDYVIDAFNADVPYDRFLHEQLAGDILAGRRAARGLRAAGHRHRFRRPGEAVRHTQARRHSPDHRGHTQHDRPGRARPVVAMRTVPRSQVRPDQLPRLLLRFTASSRARNTPLPGPKKSRGPASLYRSCRPTASRAARRSMRPRSAGSRMRSHHAETESALALQVRALIKQITAAEERQKAAQPAASPGTCDAAASPTREVVELRASLEAAKKKLSAQIKPLKDQLTNKEKELPVPANLLAYAVREGQPTDVKIQKGGNPHDLGELVTRGVPNCLDDHPSLAIPKDSSGRLELARWLTSGPARALTARVMVNRIWQHHFGKPIVPTPSDFGLRGTPPTHPELLDWLAREFIASGWSIKAMHRKIMLSKTYQLSADRRHGQRRDRHRKRLVLAVRPPGARRRGAARHPARPRGQPRHHAARASPVPGRDGLALHRPPPVQGGIRLPSPQRLPDGSAPAPAPLPGHLQRPGHQHDDRRPRRLFHTAPGPFPAQQSVRSRAIRPVRAVASETAVRSAGESPPGVPESLRSLAVSARARPLARVPSPLRAGPGRGRVPRPIAGRSSRGQALPAHLIASNEFIYVD